MELQECACVRVHVRRRGRGQGGSWDRVYLEHVVAAQRAARPVVGALPQALRGVGPQALALVPIDRLVEEPMQRHVRMPLRLLGLGVGCGVRLTVGVEAVLRLGLGSGWELVGAGVICSGGEREPAPRCP